jgi:hypothetical protein
VKNGYANLSKRGGGEGSNKFEHKFYKYEQPTMFNVLESNVTICPYGVLGKDVARISKIYIFLSKTSLSNAKPRLQIKRQKEVSFLKTIRVEFFHGILEG